MLSGGSSTNEDLLGGKTLTSAFGLGWYHYGARFYDGALARWTTMDPADEFHSPYSYVGGDPVNLVDPDGRQVRVANPETLFDRNVAFRQPDGSLAARVESMGRISRFFDGRDYQQELNSLTDRWKDVSPNTHAFLSNIRETRAPEDWIPVYIAESIAVGENGISAAGIEIGGNIALDVNEFTEATVHQEILHLMGASEFEAYAGDFSAGLRPLENILEAARPGSSFWEGFGQYAEQFGSSVEDGRVVDREQFFSRFENLGNQIVGK